MAYEVVLDKFSGPLDLLLHLIRKQELNIHDIPIAMITDQYLSYLHAMDELSLEIASEFLVMAATLLAIKSRMLLPRPEPEPGQEEDVDPRAELVEQLLEYQRAKWAAEQLKEREQRQSLVFTREALDLTPYAPTDPPPVTGVTLWDLVDAFRSLLRKTPKEQPAAEIRGHVVSVEAMMEQMTHRLRLWKTCTFSQLLQFARTRSELVSGFLALLELVKNRVVVCEQRDPFAEITISLEEIA
ncbi:segregation/condensation protein A [Alicyclobacillus cycloheptanicus]|uniref:Segregation and condensation protein A n=1 Tax=Alicyclobacillus cycloheptanicus TaxID=1457 RepID=A0ABT9XDR6_9BACL|nr:segregation/condensation protein A [Alicyclobacillus cycloheptanicus]MDQ0188444.1 segregation and condensation protein A [Alicyclobacillus cycloheptanicus]WDM01141.1 segregation/condensation protein A [Alicyclobacillus cycloheptanicus]